MPTIASSNVPTPKSWDEFEDITLAAAKLRWNSSNFYRNGRAGQKQDGVDIWGHDGDNRHIGVQCKNTVDGVSLTTVKDEIANAEAFEPKLDRLYIATTAKRDAVLQKAVREISEQRARHVCSRSMCCSGMTSARIWRRTTRFFSTLSPVQTGRRRGYGA
jgi:hypothetical protein